MQRIRYAPQQSVYVDGYNATEQIGVLPPLTPGYRIRAVHFVATSKLAELFSTNVQWNRIEVYLCLNKPATPQECRDGLKLLDVKVPMRYDAAYYNSSAENGSRGSTCELPVYAEILSGSGVLAVVLSSNAGDFSANVTFAVEPTT